MMIRRGFLLLCTIVLQFHIIYARYTGYFTSQATCFRCAKKVVAFGYSTCILTKYGMIKCFGFDHNPVLAMEHKFDSLFIGSHESHLGNALIPVWLGRNSQSIVEDFAVTGAKNVEMMCVKMTIGAIKCWGSNEDGGLGYEDTQDRSTNYLSGDEGSNLLPVNLGTNLLANQVTIGNQFGCALLQPSTGGAKTVKCWGRNSHGQLMKGHYDNIGDKSGDMGDNLTNINIVINTDSREPQEISAGSDHVCARLDNDTVTCWGKNDKGQLGRGTKTLSNDDIERDCMCGRSPQCTPSQGSSIIKEKCIGDDATDELKPVVDANGNAILVLSITALSDSTCAILKSDYSIMCWGSNEDGALGVNVKYGESDGNLLMSEYAVPNVILGSRKVSTISGGVNFGCALLGNGDQDSDSLICWGKNKSGQLGIGSTQNIGEANGDAGTIVDVSGTISQCSHGDGHSCAILTNESIKCWGSNFFGQLGAMTTKTSIGDEADEMGSHIAEIDIGAEPSNCKEPATGEYVTQICENGSRGVIGDNTKVTSCTLPQSTEFVSTACVKGKSNVVGSNTGMTLCSDPTSGKYAHAVCNNGQIYIVGANTDIRDCSNPENNFYVTAVCVAGTHSVKGEDTVKQACTGVTNSQFVTSLCVSGKYDEVGVDTGWNPCSEPEYETFVSAVCENGNPSELGEDTVITTCSAPVIGGYVESLCVPGVPYEVGENTKLGTCSTPNALEWTEKICIKGRPSQLGANTVIQFCSKPIRIAEEEEYVIQVCDNGSDKQLGMDTISTDCTRPRFESTCKEGSGICEYTEVLCDAGTEAALGTDTKIATCSPPSTGEYVQTSCKPGSPVEEGKNTKLGSLGTCPRGYGLTASGDINNANQCGPCIVGTYSNEDSDLPCKNWSICPVGKGSIINGTAMTNRVCDHCEEGKFSDTAGSGMCQPLSTCPLEYGVVFNGTVKADRICEACPFGRFSAKDDSSRCKIWSKCPEGEGRIAQGTNSTDLVCSPCVGNTYSDVDDDSECIYWTNCTKGEGLLLEGTDLQDRLCEDCEPGKFSDLVGDATCKLWDMCPVGSGVAVPGGSSANIVCEVCPEGKYSLTEDDTPCEEDFNPIFIIIVGGTLLCGLCVGVAHYQLKKYKAKKELARRRARIKPKRTKKRKKRKSKKKKKKKNKVAPE